MKPSHAETSGNLTKLDKLKWFSITLLSVAAILANSIYGERFNIVTKALVLVILIAIASTIAVTTSGGKVAYIFLHEARLEVRKVVWPSSNEALKITLVVLAVSTIMALVLQVVDSIIVHLVALATGS